LENPGKLIQLSSRFQRWICFPEIDLTHDQKIEISKKKLDEFARKRSESPLGKLKFRKNIWMSFPGFAIKG